MAPYAYSYLRIIPNKTMSTNTTNQHTYEQFKLLCEQAGIKLTHQRLEIFQELMEVKGHPSAEAIHSKLQERMPTIALDTVYRTLATFDQLGVLKKLHIGSDKTLFDTNLDIHHHFVCTQCNKVEDIYWPDFDQFSLPQQFGELGEVHSRHLELHGVCADCQKKQSSD